MNRTVAADDTPSAAVDALAAAIEVRPASDGAPAAAFDPSVAALGAPAADPESAAVGSLDDDEDEQIDGSLSVEASPGGVPSQHPDRVRRLCWRLQPVAGQGRWIIAGPMREDGDVDPLKFTMAIVVEGLRDLSSREVYARAVPMLVKRNMYKSVAAAHASLEHVRMEYDGSSTGLDEPSWAVDMTHGLPFRRILDRAAAFMKQDRVALGLVKFISFQPLSMHPWYAYKLRLLAKRGERRGAVSYRRALSRLTDDDERRLLRAANSAALSAVRKATTYNALTAADKAGGKRRTKKRPWRDVRAPDVIPARKKLIGMKRRVFERCNRVGHSMLTLDGDGAVVPWTYVPGSGLSGVRLYQAPTGAVKRLASHSHKQRKDAPGAATSSGRVSSAAGEDHDFLGGEDGALPYLLERPLSLAELTILKSSTLEDADGTGTEMIIAVEFDIVAAMQAAIGLRTKPCSAQDVLEGGAAWTAASDGGPIRRSALTIFTLVLSASWLVAGRTAMVPVLYLLSGEQHVHSAFAARLDMLIGRAVRTTYDVHVNVTSGDTDSESSASFMGPSAPRGGSAEEQSVCTWTGPQLVRIAADFAMIDHLLGLTGGSDDSRCPFWWPCSSKTFLSLCAHAAAGGGPRTVQTIERQWELACWVLGRWCALRGGRLTLSSGSITARCSTCNQVLPLDMPLQSHVPCRAPACVDDAESGAETVPVILPTPLSDMFLLLRRRCGGVRGYPALRSVPLVIQVPVLHCTGNIMKKLLFFFLAELGKTPKAIAKQGMYSVTGRVNLGHLYMREHIQLVSLILACPDIVGVPVESAFLSMWSLALLMTAAWRQALTAPMQERVKAVAVMELAAGLLAPLWSCLKPLDKESKGAGVTSMYLHAVLVHARDSLGVNSPAEAVITDDHAEGRIRDMNKHCKTRINNVARAQAVTELQALADDTEECTSGSRFTAELKIYTRRVEVCACCATRLGVSETADINEAVARAKGTGLIVEDAADDEEEPTGLTMVLPSSLLHDQKELEEEDAGKPWLSKDRKVARALSQRLRTLHVCICGAARHVETGPLALRLQAVRAAAAEDESASFDVDAAQPQEHPRLRDTPIVRHKRAQQNCDLSVEDARCLLVRHTPQCRRGGDDGCEGLCVRECDDGDSEIDIDERDDCAQEDTAVHHRQACGPDGFSESEAVAAGDGEEPMLAIGVLQDSQLRPFAPPVDFVRGFFSTDGGLRIDGDAAADICRNRLAEEDALMRIFLVRMHTSAFLTWAASSGVHLEAMREAVKSIMRRLDSMRAALPGADVVTL